MEYWDIISDIEMFKKMSQVIKLDINETFDGIEIKSNKDKVIEIKGIKI